jgi:general secretion pathway protein I
VKRAARESGFTLMEVLVALVIVAFGMGAVMSALTSAANNTQRLREKSFAEWVGLNQLALARLSRAMPSTSKSEGDADFAGLKWHWVQQATDMQIPGVRRIVIQVRHADEPMPGNGPKPPEDWLATVTGFRGDAIGAPQGTLPPFDSTASQGPGTGAPGTGAPGTGAPGTGAPPVTNPGGGPGTPVVPQPPNGRR